MKSARCFFLFSALILFSVFTLSAVERPAFFQGVRQLGMGGAGIALSDDPTVFFYNPSLIAIRKDLLFNIFSLRASVSSDVLDTMDFMDKNQDDLENFDSLTSERQEALMDEIVTTVTKNKNHFTFTTPDFCIVPKAGRVNLGLGLFTGVDFGVRIKKGILVPKVDFFGNADAVFMFPIAMKIPTPLPGQIAAALSPKYIYRASLNDELTVLEFDNYDVDLQPGKGIGFDLSFIWEMTERLRVGGIFNDITRTKISYDEVSDDGAVKKAAYSDRIKPDLALGLYYKVPYLRFINVVADARRLLDKSEPFRIDTLPKKLHLGGEVNFKVITFRGGFYQGYPSFGLGLDLWILELDYAFWGRETGFYAGQIPEYNHMVSLALRF
ncbi:MAG TPA: hypothetical protein VJC03_06665 [bacterium]|nr:hypothetical protein [bacterium]